MAALRTLATRAATKAALKRFGLAAAKRFGQNFLIDAAVLAKIVEAARLDAASTVLEIGPGLGTLTQALAATGAQVVAVELDKKLLPALEANLADYSNVRIIQGDILKLDIASVCGNSSFSVCANLPYYITTPVLMRFFEEDLPWQRLVVMLQREVAERILARPASRAYGALTVAAQYYSEPELVTHVAASAFLPEPQVESAVVAFERRSAPPVLAEPETFFRVVRAAFSKRRKMLSNALAALAADALVRRAWLERAKIDGRRRAETLSLAEFASLANTLEETAAGKMPPDSL